MGPVDVVRVMQMCMWYQFNMSHDEILEAVYGTGHNEGYMKEKSVVLSKGILYFYAQLDEAHKRQLATAILAKYGNDSLTYVTHYHKKRETAE